MSRNELTPQATFLLIQTVTGFYMKVLGWQCPPLPIRSYGPVWLLIYDWNYLTFYTRYRFKTTRKVINIPVNYLFEWKSIKHLSRPINHNAFSHILLAKVIFHIKLVNGQQPFTATCSPVCRCNNTAFKEAFKTIKIQKNARWRKYLRTEMLSVKLWHFISCSFFRLLS